MRTPFEPPASSTEDSAAPGSQHHVYDHLDLNQFPEGPFRDVFQYWLGLRIDGRVPLVSAFDLLDLSSHVPNIVIADCHETRIKFRYSGEGFNVETGQDLTGIHMDELSSFDDIRERAEICKITGEPYVVTDHPVTWTSQNFKSYSTLAVPLADADGNIVRIVYVLVYS